ncbi:hypothetical protein [Sphingomonas sp. LHG3406-1]|uniref:hypothetical protein n=1 Tax=Sphingomonas sp. LHG3406-1 TaxID=2804617 RepID=UPI0026386D74|nr:hypothetical protein [Sphingomonas sp. LHG3406-1]
MRPSAVPLLLLALTACGDRRSFDERYSDTSDKLEQKARQLDENLAAAANAADSAGNEAGGSTRTD